MKNTYKFFRCDCGMEGIVIDKFQDDMLIYFSIWNYGFGEKLSILKKLSWCWYILKNGHTSKDDIVLNKKTAQSLGKYLIEISK